MTPTDFAVMPIWFLAFLFSTTCHEAAHAWVAKLGGDLTAYEGGQVSLDPIPHMRREPFGMVLVPLISYLFNVMTGRGPWMIGWASAPYDPLWAARHPRRAAWMALAGPAANFSIAISAGVAIIIACHLGWFTPEVSNLAFDHLVSAPKGAASAAATFLSILFSLNVMLGAFNLLPVPPLDGCAAVPLFLPERIGERWRSLWAPERGLATIGLLVAWMVFGRVAGFVWVHSVTVLLSALPSG